MFCIEEIGNCLLSRSWPNIIKSAIVGGIVGLICGAIGGAVLSFTIWGALFSATIGLILEDFSTDSGRKLTIRIIIVCAIVGAIIGIPIFPWIDVLGGLFFGALAGLIIGFVISIIFNFKGAVYLFIGPVIGAILGAGIGSSNNVHFGGFIAGAVIGGVIVSLICLFNCIHKKKRISEQEGEKAKKEKYWQDLRTRATSGDEAAKVELIEIGTDIHGFFSYENFDYDANALQWLMNTIIAAISEKGGADACDNFTMEEVKQVEIGTGITGFTSYKSKGKTHKGDSLEMEYQIGRSKAGRLTYSLNLKLLPEIAFAIWHEIDEKKEIFKRTLTKWTPAMDQVSNGYRSNNYSTTSTVPDDKDPKENSKIIHVYANSYGYGDVAYTITEITFMQTVMAMVM